MKSGEFKKLPEEVQQLYMQHDEEHTQAEQRQAAELAAKQMAAGGQEGGGQSQGQGGPPPESSVPASANGQQAPEGPPSQFTSASSPRTLMEGGPQ